jgi:AraC-like DNA-binding protein
VPSRLSLGAFRRYEAQAQHVTVVAPYTVHGEGSAVGETGTWYVLYVAPALLKDLHGGSDPVFPYAVISDATSALELRDLVRRSGEGALTGSEFVSRASGWLRRLLGSLAVRDALPEPVRAVDRVRAYLQAHATDPVSFEELAAAAGTTPSVVRAFSRVMGLPLKSYHAQLRLARARRLLAQGRSATWVAYECGFADQSHLSRRFKECHGVTPGVFQAQWRTRPDVAWAAAIS